jgi:hypothetical protein
MCLTASGAPAAEKRRAVDLVHTLKILLVYLYPIKNVSNIKRDPA